MCRYRPKMGSRSRSGSRSRRKRFSSRTGESSHGVVSKIRKSDPDSRSTKRRSRSASVPRRGVAGASKRKSKGHSGGRGSASPKRRRHSDAEKGAKQPREAPRKQEADSTNEKEKSKMLFADAESRQQRRRFRHVHLVNIYAAPNKFWKFLNLECFSLIRTWKNVKLGTEVSSFPKI